MSNKEREVIAEYIREVFHYEHQLSAEILARLLLLCELLIEKGILNEEDVFKKLDDVNVAIMLGEIDFGDSTWDEEHLRSKFDKISSKSEE